RKPAGFRRFAGVGPPAVRSNSWQRMRPARAAILDFNGTVAEDEALLMGIYEDLLREQGVAFEAAHYWRYAGLPDQAMFEHLFAAHGRRLEPTTVDLLLRERVERYLAAVSDEHPAADHTMAVSRV